MQGEDVHERMDEKEMQGRPGNDARFQLERMRAQGGAGGGLDAAQLFGACNVCNLINKLIIQKHTDDSCLTYVVFFAEDRGNVKNSRTTVHNN